MFTLTMYNNDCVFSHKLNRIVYDDEPEYKIFISWKKSNPNDYKNILKEKNKKLLWNQGEPHNDNGTFIFYNNEGEIIKKQKNNIISYVDKGHVYKVENLTTNLIKEFGPCGNVFKLIKPNIEIEYDLNTGNVTKHTTLRGNLKYIISYVNKKVSHTQLYKKNILLKLKSYYPNTRQVKKLKRIKVNKYLYNEYFLNGQLRSRGMLWENEPHGRWTYYHFNGNIESEHRFHKGNLKGISKLYHEDGTRNLKVKS